MDESKIFVALVKLWLMEATDILKITTTTTEEVKMMIATTEEAMGIPSHLPVRKVSVKAVIEMMQNIG